VNGCEGRLTKVPDDAMGWGGWGKGKEGKGGGWSPWQPMPPGGLGVVEL
jgi:hypothetical protein